MKFAIFAALFIAPAFAGAQVSFDKIGRLAKTFAGFELRMTEPVIHARGSTFVKVYDVYELKLAYPGFQTGKLTTAFDSASEFPGSLIRVRENGGIRDFDDGVFREVETLDRIVHYHPAEIEFVEVEVLVPAPERKR